MCDFGAVVSGKDKSDKNIQPTLYRSPEVMLGIPRSYEVDIWNVGCIVRRP